MAQAPGHIRDRLRMQQELMNIHPLGSSETFGCYNDQLNVAPAEAHDFGERVHCTGSSCILLILLILYSSRRSPRLSGILWW